ncbi:XrtA/PEP-CTERM system TPR-repeat protein PrsT [Thalassomonas actiniarum]|uniref:PEP-CTERM system TPR-repeat protein PrsT n=1 Tax=Thalassomonas actiniarum TaxID=485447 RepID=A0AAF0C4N4_9GAMM|nr:XrtA/PEP-CTERM system TPR-repeat protein PrsT [Thalassomonas actiniarum]WDE00673.1 PEP-CTERM system TPR-repeat protein PrsT [Thalassomonas actiniarum]
MPELSSMAKRQLKRIHPIFLTLILGCFAASKVLAFTFQEANQAYEDALRSFAQSDLKAAVLYLKNSLKNNPSHLPSKILMAEVLIAQGDGASAEIELTYALKHGADEKRILPLLLEAQLLQKKYEQVVASNFPPGSNARLKSQITMLKGRAFVAQKKYVRAEQIFRQSLTYNGNNVLAILGRAQVALLRENLKQARTYAEQALAKDPTNTNGLLMLANIEQMQGHKEAALTKVNEIIALNRENFPALLMRAGLLIDKGQYQAALLDVTVILNQIPNEPRANYLKAITNIALGNEAESDATIKHLKTVLTGVPDEVMQENPVYYYLAGVISFGQGEYLQAQDALRKYFDINKEDTRALKLLAKTEFRLNEPFAAKSYLVKARLINPDDVETWSLLGRAYMATEAPEKAEKYFLDVIRALPRESAGRLDIARLYLSTGQVDKAIVYLQQAEELANAQTDKGNLYLLFTRAYQDNNQIDMALSSVEKVIALRGQDSFLYQLKGSLLGLNGEHEKARLAFEQALTFNAGNYQAVLHLARMEMLSGNIKQSNKRLQQYIEQNAPNTSLMLELGQNYLRLNEPANALTWFEKAYAQDRGNNQALIQLVNYYSKLNDIPQALSLVEDYLDRFNKDGEILLIAADLYLKDKQNDKALQAHQLAVKHSEEKAAALLALAKTQVLFGEDDNAVTSLEKAIVRDGRFTQAYLQLIDIYHARQDFDNAMSTIVQLEKVLPGRQLTTVLKGDTYRLNNQYARAVSAYQAALKIKPSQQATLGLYRVYQAKEQYQQAVDLLEARTSSYPDDLLSAVALADSYKALGELEKAADFYESLIKRFPNAPVLFNNAAAIYLALKHFDKAAEYAEAAYARLPDNVAIIDTKAWVETQRGNYQRALPLYRQALALDVDNMEVLYHLAYTLSKMGRSDEAITYLQDVLANGQAYAGKKEAEALLKSLQP